MKHIIRQHTRRAVLVTLKTGETFQGVLFEADAESLVLRDASLVANGARVPVDGALLVLRPDIAYMQFP